MIDAVTLFRNRITGFTYEVDLGACRRLVAYASGAIKPSKINSLSGENDKDPDRPLRDLVQLVEVAGGGIIIDIRQENPDSPDVLTVATRACKRPLPARMLRLSPHQPAGLVGLTRAGKRVGPREHFIVPVDEDAERQLDELLRVLKWFPEDVESLLLNTIRQPSLAEKVDRIYQKVVEPAREATEPNPASALLRKFLPSLGEASGSLGRRADVGVAGLLRGGATTPAGRRTGQGGEELMQQGTSLREVLNSHWRPALVATAAIFLAGVLFTLAVSGVLGHSGPTSGEPTVVPAPTAVYTQVPIPTTAPEVPPTTVPETLPPAPTETAPLADQE